jgi:uncharacterized repeat protein (TIGR02543 family)
MKKKCLLGALFLALCFSLSGCTSGGSSFSRDPDQRYTVLLSQGDGYSIEGAYVYKIEKGGSVSFTVSVEEGMEVESVSYGYFDYANSQIVCEDIRANLTVVLKTVAIKNSYEVLFDFNGGYAAENETQTYTVKQYDPAIRVRGNTLSAKDVADRDGYTFTGWNTAEDGTGEHIGAGSRITLDSEGRITLYAEWQPWTSANDFDWTVGDTFTLKKYKGNAETVVIPATVNGKEVTEISANAFVGGNVKTVVLPNTVQTVCSNAFFGCGLEELYLFDNVVSIEDDSFEYCSSFTTVHMNAIEAPRYTTSWFSCWADKYDRVILNQDKKQMVFFSGSSMYRGLDSSLIDEAFDHEYVITNLGVSYLIDATLQLELLYKYLKAGDILVHAPEDLSNVESGNSFHTLTWRCLESNYDLLADMNVSWHESVWSTFTDYNEDRQDVVERDYDQRLSECNEYGDLSTYRANTDDTDKGYDVVYDATILRSSILEDLNTTYQNLESKGITVYFSYSPANLDGEGMPDEATRALYEAKIQQYITSVPIISSLEDYMYSGRYFTNTNYHLSTEGAEMRTEQLIADIKKQMDAE